MNHATTKKWLLYAVLVSILLIGLAKVCFADEISVQINAESPAAGVPLKAELSGIEEERIVYRWYVANEDTGVTASLYTPTATDYEAWIEVAVFDGDSGERLGSDRIYFSPLPVVYIRTEDEQAVASRAEYIGGEMFIQGNGAVDAQYDGKIQIKGRGSKTWDYDKKPYKLKLDKKSNLFGFGKSKHYVLLANYLDPSLMRNSLGYRLSAQLGLIAVDTTWVDVVFNGEYVGNYQLCEHIRIGKQLVDITDWESVADDVAEAICETYPEDFSKSDASALEKQMEDDLSWVTDNEVVYHGKTYVISEVYDRPFDISGGYLFEMGSDYDEDVTHFITNRGIKTAVSKPEFLYTNPEMLEYAQSYLQSLEDALAAADGYNADGVHYSELADIDSMVAYWLTMELLGNEDAASRSRFCYKPVGEKLVFGPAWDFDIGGGSYRSFFGAKLWSVTGTVVGWYTGQDFWKEFVDDPYFQIKAQEKYWEIRPYLSELIADGGIIDTYCDELYESAVANEMLWTGENYVRRSFTGNAGDVVILKEFLTSRFRWFDSVFYSENSTTFWLYNFLSSNPYKRSSQIRFQMENAAADREKHGAQYQMSADTDAVLKVFVPSGSETSLYINGIFYGTFASDELASGIIIPGEKFSEEPGRKNVISAISLTGSLRETNYTTVRIGEACQAAEEEADQPICQHDLNHIEARDATAQRYGLQESWYCNTCRNYFADCDGNEPLGKSEVVISPATAVIRNGVRQQIERVASIILACCVNLANHICGA